MNKKINFLLASLAITVGLFIYLTVHHYAVKLGVSGDAICSINAKINCDAAAASAFAEVFGIPVAVAGGVFSLFVFGFVLFLKMNWMQKSAQALGTLRFMLSIAALVSLVMGTISLAIVKVVCPFCTATYVFAFLNLYLGWSLFRPEEGSFRLGDYFSAYRSHLILLICIPVTSWLVAGMIQEQYGLTQLKQIIPEKIYQWQTGPSYTFTEEGLIHKGSDNKVTLVEFADFKCPHCKAASQVLDVFLKGNPDVTLIYKPYPLDGTCNKSMPSKGDGTRCTMAAWAICAEKQGHGWDMHHWLFDKQEELFQVTDLKTYFNEVEKDLKIDAKALAECSDSNETYELINRTATEGKMANVEGTPTIYLNNKKLPYGQVLDILKAAVKEVR